MERCKRILGIKDVPVLKFYSIWANSVAIWKAVLEGDPYPVRGGFCQSGDVMNMGNILYGWQALKTLDFLADADLWHAPTTQMADVLMPVRHWMEVDYPRRSQGSSGTIGLTVKCIEPPGEARFDPDMIADFG
jgi:anaerobic selenocysteine-containing dehydrogenase